MEIRCSHSILQPGRNGWPMLTARTTYILLICFSNGLPNCCKVARMKKMVTTANGQLNEGGVHSNNKFKRFAVFFATVESNKENNLHLDTAYAAIRILLTNNSIHLIENLK